MRILTFIVIFCFWTMPAIVFAAPNLGIGNGTDAANIGNQAGYDISVNSDTLPQTIGRVVKVILAFVGTIFFVLSVYAGFLWMTAQGNSEQVAKATGIFRTAVIGMIIVLAAYSITAFALIFAGQSTSINGKVGN